MKATQLHEIEAKGMFGKRLRRRTNSPRQNENNFYSEQIESSTSHIKTQILPVTPTLSEFDNNPKNEIYTN